MKTRVELPFLSIYEQCMPCQVSRMAYYVAADEWERSHTESYGHLRVMVHPSNEEWTAVVMEEERKVGATVEFLLRGEGVPHA